MTEPETLSRTDCLELMSSQQVGRVAFRTPMGPRIVPVNYTVDDGDILFRTTPYSELGTYGADTEVAFEVDAIDDERHAGISVVAHGRAQLLRSVDDRRVQDPKAPRPWAQGRRDSCFRLHPRDLTGRLVRP